MRIFKRIQDKENLKFDKTYVFSTAELAQICGGDNALTEPPQGDAGFEYE